MLLSRRYSRDRHNETYTLYAAKGFNVITCDISPNISGIREVDDRNVSELYNVVQNVVIKTLKTGGHFILKAFFSDDFKTVKLNLATLFTLSLFSNLLLLSASSGSLSGSYWKKVINCGTFIFYGVTGNVPQMLSAY